jgi:exopolysaccharide biosynthesis protein
MAGSRIVDGMKLAELAEYMAGLGCTEAMNLDGGKSAQMWLNGRIVNSPPRARYRGEFPSRGAED